ncbi:polysaccharide deacetylase family protein [Pasteuria penetrans]|uniref:polysaccharide deacetylase family protein n=1 Tax=Pasteuria penetrans TaxID=86005 RepID=UPI0011EDF58F|nr:polysaccharide deacetylase family protein [Pasteuria penetrans]
MITVSDFSPSVIEHGPRRGKAVAITIDDAPSDSQTQRILKILKKERVKAHFFVIGENVQHHPDRLCQIVSDGHTVGAHSWDHASYLKKNREEVWEDLKKTREEVYKIIHRRIRSFRFPYGESDSERRKWVAEAGYVMVGWDVDSLDWELGDRIRNPKEIVISVLREARPGSIILFHDNGKYNKDYEAYLPQIIHGLRVTLGLEIVPLDQLIREKPYGNKVNRGKGIGRRMSGSPLDSRTPDDLMGVPKDTENVGCWGTGWKCVQVLVYSTYWGELHALETGRSSRKGRKVVDEPSPYRGVVLVAYYLAYQLRRLGIGSCALIPNSCDDPRCLVERVLKNYGPIPYLVDVHRDTARRDQSTVECEGDQYAGLTFIVGGASENFCHNIALAFDLYDGLNLICPGLAREVIAKKGELGRSGEYHPFLSPKSFLIEVGGADHILSEAYRSMEVLAYVLRNCIFTCPTRVNHTTLG